MLEYSMTVLEKVSFNRDLFRKELYKSTLNLKKDELEVLRRWCSTSFTKLYPDVLNEVFGSYSA